MNDHEKISEFGGAKRYKMAPQRHERLKNNNSICYISVLDFA
jgi:hypothetical protein